MYRIRLIRGKIKTGQGGFNLIEMAIVMIILGTLLGGLIVPLATQHDAAKRKEVEAQLDEIHNALLGFAASTGRLPCPSTAASAGQSAPNTATLACTSAHGFVPARTLGIVGSTGGGNLLIDPWQNPIRYSLSTAGGGAYSNNITQGLVPDFQICAQSACANVLADNVVAVVFSTGDDGTVTTSVDQLENTDGDVLFVERTLSEAAGAEFNDHLVWLSPNTLIYQLVKSGQIN